MSVARKNKTSDQKANQRESLVRIFKAHKAVTADDIQLLTVMTIFSKAEKVFYGEYQSVIDAISVLEKRFPKIKTENIQYVDHTLPAYDLIYPSAKINKLQVAVQCWAAEITDLVEFEQEGGWMNRRDAIIKKHDVMYVGDNDQGFQTGKEFLNKMIHCEGKPESVFKTVFGTLFVWWHDDSHVHGMYTFALFEHDKTTVSYAFLTVLNDNKVY